MISWGYSTSAELCWAWVQARFGMGPVGIWLLPSPYQTRDHRHRHPAELVARYGQWAELRAQSNRRISDAGVVAVDIGGTQYRLAVVSREGEILLPAGRTNWGSRGQVATQARAELRSLWPG